VINMLDLSALSKNAPSRRQLAQQLSAATAQLSTNRRAAQFAVNLFGFDPTGKIENVTLGATSITNEADLEAVKIGFRAAVLQAVAGDPDPMMALAFESPSTHAAESYKWLGDLPQMEEWKGDRIMAMLEAFSWAIKNKPWQATLRVKNDDLFDDALGLFPTHIAGMGDEARNHPAVLVAKLILNGFDGEDASIGDGLAFDGCFFFDDAHPTGSNKLTLPFSGDNLAQAVTMLRKQKRFDGRKLNARPTHVLVGIDDEQALEKVLSSDLLANAAGTASESNTLRGKYRPIISPEIENGEWFVADLSSPVKPVIYQNREGVTTQTIGGRVPNGKSDMVGFMYDETWFSAETRGNVGYFDFRRIVGSKPT
jgi:phage major head subunit gpT-like protein